MNSALQQVVDFLKAHPPFSFLPPSDLALLAERLQLRFVAAGEVLFREFEPPEAHFYIVKKGRIQLLQSEGERSLLIDECDEGEIIGIRALFAEDFYISTAIAAEDSLVFVVPAAPAKSILLQHPQVSLFFASGFAVGISKGRGGLEASLPEKKSRYFLSPKKDSNVWERDLDKIFLNPFKQILSCPPSWPVWKAAQAMSQSQVGSILVVDERLHPLGIITDTDLRKKVVARQEQVKQLAVSNIMSSPVKTVLPNLSVLELMLHMTSSGVSHLCITQDGSPHSPALGILSQRDVLMAQGQQPALLAKKMRRSSSVEELAALRQQAEDLVKHYLQQELAVPLVSKIITEINDILIQKAIALAEEALLQEGWQVPQQTSFCWLSLGSEGRKEQFLRTDQDNALVYDDSIEEQAGAYFLAMSRKCTDILVACGFAPCPADMMASNPQWCQPLSQWKRYFGDWIASPDEKALMMSTIFFDFRPVAGNFALAEQLKDFVFQKTQGQDLFFGLLAQNALQNLPPLSFFKNFVVEKSGEHKDLFDIKARAMMPLADAARLLTYSLRLPLYSSTFERFEAIAKAEPSLREVCEAAALGYEILMRHRALQGFAQGDSGRYINPQILNKLERQMLRNIFQTIAQLQEIISVRFRTNFLR